MKPLLCMLAVLAVLGGAPAARAVNPPASDQPVRQEYAPGRLKILGLSLLVPGLGHRSLGSMQRSYAFMGAEATIWSAFGVFRVQGKLRKDSYIEMAELFAGVPDAHGRTGDYYRRVGTYRSSEEYNDEVRRDARSHYGDDLQARADYFARHRVPDDQVWYWSSPDAWDRYKAKRRTSNEAHKRAGTMIGVAVANRLLAAVDALRMVHRMNSDQAMSFYITADPSDPRGPARLCVSLPLR